MNMAKDPVVAAPQLQQFPAIVSAKSSSDAAYRCQVTNIESHIVYEGNSAKKNTAIKEARQACLAGAKPQQCSVSFVCKRGLG